MNKAKCTAAIASILVILPSITHAKPPRFYVGGSMGTTIIFDSGISNLTGTASLTEGGTPFKVFGGYNINNTWSVDASYVLLGKVAEVTANNGDSFNTNGTVLPSTVDGMKLEMDGSLVTVAAKYNYPLNNKSTVYGLLGVASYKINQKLSSPLGPGSLDAITGTDLMYGVGYKYTFGKKDRLAVHVDYDGYNIDSGNNVLGMLSLGLSISFK